MHDEYEDKRVKEIDEEICALLHKRKVMTNNNPGCPPMDQMEEWAKTYQLEKEMIVSIFHVAANEEEYRPMIQPKGYVNTIPQSLLHEEDGILYSVPALQTYQNATVLLLQMVCRPERVNLHEPLRVFTINVKGSKPYRAQMTEGNGGDAMQGYRFVVSPAIQEEVTIVVEEKEWSKKTPLTTFEWIVKA
ncbi:hypothetical protein JCM19047_3322 [Bacillus sp. JCM 19047]|nr:hypothetical protein JCM19047_3322 [Bacillus sp. JCM 19047]